jgi:hypothetical protein
MKTTVRICWENPDGRNHQIFDNWGEMIHFLCQNKKVDLKVSIFEQGCMQCPIGDLCDVWEEMEE